MNTVEALLFVEDSSVRGFCSEECIESFYNPLVEHFEECEKGLRKKYSLENEGCLQLVGAPKFMDILLRNPDEVYQLDNSLKEKTFSFISKFNDKLIGDFYMVLICYVFNKQVSFILSATSTNDLRLLEEYKIGNQVQNLNDLLSETAEDTVPTVEVDQETINEVELKKSNFLADLLEQRSPADIPFEDFHLYDSFFENTLEEPDEVYSYKDNDGDYIFSYIKAHEREGTSFYFFVLCMKCAGNMSSETEMIIPILSFPSVDGELYRLYKKGELITGELRN